MREYIVLSLEVPIPNGWSTFMPRFPAKKIRYSAAAVAHPKPRVLRLGANIPLYLVKRKVAAIMQVIEPKVASTNSRLGRANRTTMDAPTIRKPAATAD